MVPVVAANRVGEERLMEDRLSWELFRDRRPEIYEKICSAATQKTKVGILFEHTIKFGLFSL